MKCNCCGKGYTEVDGEHTTCICRVYEIFERYLKPFKGKGRPHPNVVQFVNKLLIRHSALEKELSSNSHKEITVPRKWFIIDPEPPTKSRREENYGYGAVKKLDLIQIDYKKWFESGINLNGLGIPKDFYLHLFLQYLISTQEYISYRMLNMAELTNIYYSDDSSDMFVDSSGNTTWFYGIQSKTILLTIDTVLKNKESMNILIQFLRHYSDRNIIIYATHEYRRLPEIDKWVGGDGGKFSTFKVGDKSLYDILKYDFKGEYVDLLNERTFDSMKKEIIKEGKWQSRK